MERTKSPRYGTSCLNIQNEFMKIEKYVCKSFTFVKNWYFNDKPSVAAHLCRNISVAQCKVIRIPESRKFLLVESVLLDIGIQNPAFGVQNPTKE